MSEIPPEFAGLARQFIREVAADDKRAALAILALHRPVQARLVRKPRSYLRDGTLAALAGAWEAVPRRFRIGMQSKIDRRGRIGSISEAFVAACEIQAEDWATSEHALMIEGSKFEVTPKTVSFTPIDFASIGWHALGRRYERGRERSADAVMADLKVLASAAIHNEKRYPDGVGFRLRVTHGYWLGVLGDVMIAENKTKPPVDGGTQFVVRTYIDADQ